MRENSNAVMSITPLMTKTTISKSATALTQAGTTCPISISEQQKAVFNRSQDTVATPQSKLSKIPTFYTHSMSHFLPNCITSLVANRFQQQNGSQNHNNPIQHLFSSLALLFLLIGFNTNVQAQSNANCFGPYNPAPATVWGVAEKFQSSPLIWNGATPTAADLKN